ncbi:S9 family peptidase [Jatrophihabitans telluris]|uniref:S9 family peptidase n=1 Tax=Jatrophihabitans telluris TaxID=2038343 RepID=A0ABY4R313_9ACTN|nr:S9 family peptidase [Jatrophihabitans telluris]UQX89535.1 S9 family peptidase [Jatrophihabitans telluris]
MRPHTDDSTPSTWAATPPPIADRKPSLRTQHGDEFVDEYEWLRDKQNPEVIDYLNAENEYTEARTAHLGPVRTAIFDEISARTKQTDLSVPVRRGDYWYYSRTVEGLQYAIHARVPAATDEPPATEDGAPPAEQILLDGNLVAGDSEFFSLGAFTISPDGRWLAYSVDLTGDERFTLRVRETATGRDLADEIPGAYYGAAFSAEADVVFYITVDESWRPNQVWRHVVGTPTAQDVVVFSESDERFWVGIGLTRNQRAIQIATGSKLTSEVWFIDASAPFSDPVVVSPRREGVEYDVEHAGDHLLVVHNDGAENFAVSRAELDNPTLWVPFIAGDPARRIVGIDAFADHAVLYERRDGLTKLSVLARTEAGYGEPAEITFDETLYTVEPDSNPEWSTGMFRLGFESMVTPSCVFDYRVADGELVLRKQQPVLGDVDLSRYVQSREWASAPDGTRIPLSIVARADVVRNGEAPVVLYGYGSYEHSIDPYFSIPRLSLLDRGVVYVIAHIRGGGELGRPWYEQGKLLHKLNTFTDFIAAARHLVDSGWTTPARIVAQGGSAGGLLMGAVANLAPEAFGGILAQVPFVDALTTILDPSLPLTVTEWEEWGNPLADPDVYAYMKAYTPYENIQATRYPPILAMTSLNDTRVYYVEPAKWVAKLRATIPNAEAVLLKTEMDAGHGGRSGRYDRWHEIAFYTAWQLAVLGVANDPVA